MTAEKYTPKKKILQPRGIQKLASSSPTKKDKGLPSSQKKAIKSPTPIKENHRKITLIQNKIDKNKSVHVIHKNMSQEKKKTTSASKESIMLSVRKRKSTPSIFKIRSRKHTPIVFTLEDVQDIIKSRGEKGKTPTPFHGKRFTKQEIDPKLLKEAEKNRIQKAASIQDILGFNPKEQKTYSPEKDEESRIEEKFLPYYKALIELRNHVREGIDMHSQETLKRSSKEDSGDLSSYGQHMADAGTDTFERDFALSLISNEQDVLYEIEQAIQRIKKGSYGVCEITGKKISSDRLKAVPFTRYSLEGQTQLEASKATTKERGNIFTESTLEETSQYPEEEEMEE